MKPKPMMADTDLLPVWHEDLEFRAAQADVDRLTPLRDEAERVYERAWLAAVQQTGTHTPPMGSSAWDRQQKFFALQAEHKQATVRLRTAQMNAQRSCQNIALAAGLQVIEAEIIPVIMELLPVVERYETVQAMVYDKTGTHLPELGGFVLNGESMTRWVETIRAGNKFGTETDR